MQAGSLTLFARSNRVLKVSALLAMPSCPLLRRVTGVTVSDYYGRV